MASHAHVTNRMPVLELLEQDSHGRSASLPQVLQRRDRPDPPPRRHPPSRALAPAAARLSMPRLRRAVLRSPEPKTGTARGVNIVPFSSCSLDGHGMGGAALTTRDRLHRHFCVAITRSLILSYVAWGTIFFWTSSSLRL